MNKSQPSTLNMNILFIFPYRKFPCDRVTFEAALCGCKVVANENVETWGKTCRTRIL